MRITLLLVTCAFILAPPQANACQCVGTQKPFCAVDLDAIDTSETIVFVGRVLDAGPDREAAANQLLQEVSAILAANGLDPQLREFDKVPLAVQLQLVQAIKRLQRPLIAAELTAEGLALFDGATTLAGLDDAMKSHGRGPRGGHPSTFEVLEPFIGTPPDNIAVYSGNGHGDCGYGFEQGKAYLVEAHLNEAGEWHSWSCASRSEEVDSATEALRTLRAWKAGETIAPRIYGAVFDGTFRHSEIAKTWNTPSLRLELRGSDTQRATVSIGEQGGFTFEDLAPGQYTIASATPGWQVGVLHPKLPIDLTGAGCAFVVAAAVQQQGAIRGHVLASGGDEPPSNVQIEAVEVDPSAERLNTTSANAEEGAFEIIRVEPGDYRLGVNVGNAPTGPHQSENPKPYPRTYYPGVSDPAKATIFHIERGQTIDIGAWVLPARLAERRITGQILLPGGVPANDARVLLLMDGYRHPAGQSGPTAADGHFELWPLETLTYTVDAAAYDPATDLVYRGSAVLTPDATGPVTIQLAASTEGRGTTGCFAPIPPKASTESPKCSPFFDDFLWRKR